MYLRPGFVLASWIGLSVISVGVRGGTTQVDDTQATILYNPPAAWSSSIKDAKKGDGCIHPNGSHYMTGADGGRASLIFTGTEINLWGSFIDTTPPLLNITLTGGFNGTLNERTTITPNVATINACGVVYSKTALPFAEYTIAVFVPPGSSASDFRLDGFRYVAPDESHALSQGILIVAITCSIVGAILGICLIIWLIIRFGKKRRAEDDVDSLAHFRREIAGKERGGEARHGTSGVTTRAAWNEGYGGGLAAGRFGRGVPSTIASMDGTDTDAGALDDSSAYEKVAPRGLFGGRRKETYDPRGHRRGSSSSPLVTPYDLGSGPGTIYRLPTGRPPSIGIWSFTRPTRTPSPPIAPPETPPDAPPLPNPKHFSNPHGSRPAFPGGVLSPPRRAGSAVPSPTPGDVGAGARVSRTMQRAQARMNRPKLSPLGEVDDPLARASITTDPMLAGEDQRHSTLNLGHNAPSSSRPGPGLSRVPPPPTISPQASGFGFGPQPTSSPPRKAHRERTTPRLGSTLRAFPPSPTNSDQSRLGPPKRLSQLEPLGPIPLAPPAQTLWRHFSKGKGKANADQPGVSASRDSAGSAQQDLVIPSQAQNIVILPARARDSASSAGASGMHVNMNRKRESQMSEVAGAPVSGVSTGGPNVVRIPRLSVDGVASGGHRESSITAVGVGSPFAVVRETSSALADAIPSSPTRPLPQPPHHSASFADGRDRSYGEDDNPTPPPPDGAPRSRMSHMHGLPVPGNLMGLPRPGSATTVGGDSLTPTLPTAAPSGVGIRRLVGPHAHLPPEDTRSWISPNPSLMRFGGGGFRESTVVDGSAAGG